MQLGGDRPSVQYRLAGVVPRARFMITLLGALSTIIGLVHVGAILRYLYPKNGGATPPLHVRLRATGVVDPHSGELPPFRNGVAGPFYYPMTEDQSVVVGDLVEKKVAHRPLTATNLRVVEQTCTHLGCPVNWVPGDNRVECPCHGSQFNRNLTVFHGPAARPLWRHSFRLLGDSMTILGRE